MATSVPNKVVQTKYSDYGKEFNTHSRSEFFMEAGIGYNKSKATNCAKSRNPNLKGWCGTENWEHDIESIAG